MVFLIEFSNEGMKNKTARARFAGKRLRGHHAKDYISRQSTFGTWVADLLGSPLNGNWKKKKTVVQHFE